MGTDVRLPKKHRIHPEFDLGSSKQNQSLAHMTMFSVMTRVIWSVGGSFSARVPRSSAEVRRVFVHQIVEVEGVGQ